MGGEGAETYFALVAEFLFALLLGGLSVLGRFWGGGKGTDHSDVRVGS